MEKELTKSFIEYYFNEKEIKIIRRYESLRRELWRKAGTQTPNKKHTN